MFTKSIQDIFPQAPAGIDPAVLVPEHVPAHVAIIMDGNGRWAQARGKNRLEGHKAGIHAVREAIRTASDLGVRYLTLYSFSSENWKRPREEVVGLMNLFAKTILAEVEGLHAEGVRVRVIGHTEDLPRKTREAFDQAWELTRDNTGMTLLIALNYGGRQEIVDAAQSCLDAALERFEQTGERTQLTLEDIASALYASDAPDPDLLIRTSGEKRISNFLLWQIAYSELYITELMWPDFDRYEFLRALLDFQQRSRRFGAV